MNAMAEVKVIKTAAEAALAKTYAEARGRLPGDSTIAAQRQAAFDLLAKEGLQHRSIEDWKYTDPRALMREAKPLAPTPNAAAKPQAVFDWLNETYTARYANVHRGLHYLANEATEAYEQARENVDSFLNAKRRNFSHDG